jgi:threonine synthase
LDYISTRGSAPCLDFEEATLTGLADDGGLYLPSNWPAFSFEEIRSMQGSSYSELAFQILSKFTGDCIPDNQLRDLAKQAYSNFHHPAVAPLKQLDDQLYFMELFHGPTLAFKDYALQMLGEFFQYFLEKGNRKCTIVGATSGDTGSAAIAGVRGLTSVELFMLHPEGRVSDVQRKQMTTVLDNNIHNLAVDGTFDDCQNMVKSLFNDLEFKETYSLSAVNSINWARIAAQVVYYFRAGLALGSPDKEISFSVPTGNFGNVLAGYVAKKMGLPIRKLIIGSNENDILTRFFETGIMEKRSVRATLSPSMDIGISSNFERYLFELLNHDSEQLGFLMDQFSSSGKFQVSNSLLNSAKQEFSAYRLSDEQITKDIQETYQLTGEVIDPHSIIGVSAAKQEKENETPVVVLGTAHPSKFPDAIRNALGIDAPLPKQAGDLLNMEEKYSNIENDAEKLKQLISNSL